MTKKPEALSIITTDLIDSSALCLTDFLNTPIDYPCFPLDDFDGSFAEYEESSSSGVGTSAFGLFRALDGGLCGVVTAKILHKPFPVILDKNKNA